MLRAQESELMGIALGMKDAGGGVLYVGKASCLPDRVSSYFVPSADLGARKQPMLDLIEDIEDRVSSPEMGGRAQLDRRIVKERARRLRERGGERRLAGALRAVEADGAAVMGADGPGEPGPMRGRIGPDRARGEARDRIIGQTQHPPAQRHEEAADLPRKLRTVGLAREQVVDGLGMGSRDDVAPDGPEVGAVAGRLRDHSAVAHDAAIGAEIAHPLEPRFARDGIVRQPADQHGQLVHQSARGQP